MKISNSNYKSFYFLNKIYNKKKSLSICFCFSNQTNYKFLRFSIGVTKGLFVCFVGSAPGLGNPGSITFRTMKCSAGVLGGVKNVGKVAKSGTFKFVTGTLLVGAEMIFSNDVREFAVTGVTEGVGPAMKNLQSTWSPKPKGFGSDLLNKNLTAQDYAIGAALQRLPLKEREAAVKNIAIQQGYIFARELRKKLGSDLVPIVALRGGANSGLLLLLVNGLDICLKIFTLVYYLYLFYVFLNGYNESVNEFDSAFSDYTKYNEPNVFAFIRDYYLKNYWPINLLGFQNNPKYYALTSNFIADDCIFSPSLYLENFN